MDSGKNRAPLALAACCLDSAAALKPLHALRLLKMGGRDSLLMSEADHLDVAMSW